MQADLFGARASLSIQPVSVCAHWLCGPLSILPLQGMTRLEKEKGAVRSRSHPEFCAHATGCFCRRRRSVCQTQTCAAMSFFRSPMVSSALHLTRTCARVSKRSRSARIHQAREGYIYLLSEPVVAHHLNHCALHLVSFLQPPLRPCLFRRKRREKKNKNIAGRGNPFLPPSTRKSRSLHVHCRENNVHAWATLSNPPLRDILIRTLVLPNRIRSNVWW